MKTYGARKATEFTKKQIGVIYRMAKAGDLKVEQWIMTELYDLADYYGYDDNGSVAASETKILEILEKVFAGKTEEAQALINQYTANTLELISRKRRDTINRNYI